MYYVISTNSTSSGYSSTGYCWSRSAFKSAVTAGQLIKNHSQPAAGRDESQLAHTNKGQGNEDTVTQVRTGEPAPRPREGSSRKSGP